MAGDPPLTESEDTENLRLIVGIFIQKSIGALNSRRFKVPAAAGIVTNP